MPLFEGHKDRGPSAVRSADFAGQPLLRQLWFTGPDAPAVNTTEQLESSPVPASIDNVGDSETLAEQITSGVGMPTVVTPEMIVGMIGSAVPPPVRGGCRRRCEPPAAGLMLAVAGLSTLRDPARLASYQVLAGHCANSEQTRNIVMMGAGPEHGHVERESEVRR